jgi:D-ribose pyranose/furanose isomerase RbsD
MLVSFYQIYVPYKIQFSSNECPIEYNMKKYGFEKYLPIPKTNKIAPTTFIVCLPTIMAKEFLDIIREDGCIEKIMYDEDVNYNNYKDFKGIYIKKIDEIYNMVVEKTTYVLAKNEMTKIS